MRFNTILFSTVLSALCAAPAMAWDHDFTRGLDLYSASDNGATVRLVCDPNRVYGATESMMMIVLGGNSDLNVTATLAFPDGSEITATLIHSRLSKRDLGDERWKPLLDSLRNTTQVELTVDDIKRTVILGDPPDFTCI